MKLIIKIIFKKTGKTLEPFGVVPTKLYILRKVVKQFFHHLSQQKVKQCQTTKTLLRISITFLPALAKIFKKKIFPTKKHFSNFFKTPSLTLFSFHQQHQKKSINQYKSCRLINLQVPIAYQQKFLNLLKTLYQDHYLN